MEKRDKEKYAVVIGGANLDITGFSIKPLIRQDSNPGEIKTSPGGVGRNIAENMARLGMQTRLISAVGNDAFGRKILADSAEAGVDVSMVRTVDTFPTSVYLSILDADGEMDVAVSDMQIMASLDINFLKKHHSTISRASAIVVDTNLEKETLMYLAKAYPGRMFVDTVSTSKAQKIADITGAFYTIIANRQEAELLSDIAINTINDAQIAIQHLLSRGTGMVLIGLGHEGVAYGTADEIGHFSLKNITSVNTTGAGDAFLAAMVCASLKQIEMPRAIQLASIASYLTLKAEKTISGELTWENLETTLKEFKL
jgi:pseudouridine kinase